MKTLEGIENHYQSMKIRNFCQGVNLIRRGYESKTMVHENKRGQRTFDEEAMITRKCKNSEKRKYHM